eukprot:3940525-Pleurochrysis_carterae.AAC.1
MRQHLPLSRLGSSPHAAAMRCGYAQRCPRGPHVATVEVCEEWRAAGSSVRAQRRRNAGHQRDPRWPQRVICAELIGAHLAAVASAPQRHWHHGVLGLCVLDADDVRTIKSSPTFG